MHAWEQIQDTLEYIETHLSEEISIDTLVKIGSLSPFYYQRLFSRLVKKPVAEYIKLRRMAKASEGLLEKDKRILDIALELGFSSHEQFTRSFKETFGLTPENYRAHPVALNRMTKPELLLKYTLVDEGLPLITNDIVLEVNRRTLDAAIPFVGLDITLPFACMEGLGTESGADPLDTIWQRFHNGKESALAMEQHADEIGVMLPSDQEGHFRYFVGGKTTQPNPPEGFACWELPKGQYVVCTIEAESFEALVMDALYKAQQYVYDVWLPGHHLQTEPFCAERYASHTAQTKEMEIWLKIQE